MDDKGEADLSVGFDGAEFGRPIAPASEHIRLLTRQERAAGSNADFISDSPLALASFIVSRAFGLPTPFLTGDDNMFSLIRTAISAAPGLRPIVVEGETGTGKDLLVRLIHAAGRHSGALVLLDCAALGDELIESEMGVKAGASNGENDEPQSLRRAAGGTLFLDGLGESSPATQARAARIMLESECALAKEPASARRPVRFIAATKRSLISVTERESGGSVIRGQLGFLHITLPPLRARRVDVPLLARHFLGLINGGLGFTATALRMLTEYPFPGNVRELSNVVTRLAIVPPNNTQFIDWADVRGQLMFANAQAGQAAAIWRLSRDAFRREMALHALEACGGDQEAAARKLGITQRSLLRLNTAALRTAARPSRGTGRR
jgi:two-component system, NtrC family, nitrogen regulation response regulator NtrX